MTASRVGFPRAFHEHGRKIARSVARPIYGGAGCILSFHRIVPDHELSAFPQNRALEITPQALRAMLSWVQHRGLEVIRLEEVRQRLASPRRPKFVVFTFDDGYRDNLTNALPIFRDFGMPFTLHVTTAFLSRTASVWWYAIEDVLAAREEIAFAWAGARHHFALGTREDRARAFDAISTMIRAQGPTSRDELVATFCAAGGIDPMERTYELMLTWEELKAMAGEWHVNVGSHGAAHHQLGRLSDSEAEEELIDSRAELEARLDRPVRHLAYPFGDADAVGKREFDLARDSDFTTAMTTRRGNLFHQHAWHLQALPRLVIDGNEPSLDYLRELECGLLGAKANAWRRVVVE